MDYKVLDIEGVGEEYAKNSMTLVFYYLGISFQNRNSGLKKEISRGNKDFSEIDPKVRQPC